VLILEKSAQLTRRVGEASVEASAYFMGHVLGFAKCLNEHHIAKQGLRFWFANDEVETLAEASELGTKYQVKLPSYQLDRATFDEEVLRRSCLAGATLARLVNIASAQLEEGDLQTVTFRDGENAVSRRPAGWWIPLAWPPS